MWFCMGLICKAALSAEIRFGILSCDCGNKINKKQLENTVLSSFFFDLPSATTFPTKNIQSGQNNKYDFSFPFQNDILSFCHALLLSSLFSQRSFMPITRDLCPCFKVSSAPKTSISIMAKLILDYEVVFFICVASRRLLNRHGLPSLIEFITQLLVSPSFLDFKCKTC